MELRKRQSRFSQFIIKYPIAVTLLFFIALCVIFMVFSPINKNGELVFLTGKNMANILESTAAFSIGAFAMTLVLLVGGMDLSAGSIMSLSCCVFGLALENGEGVPIAFLFAILCGLLCGLLNGFVAVRFKVPPFLATIATSSIFSGLAFLISDSRSIIVSDPIIPQIFGVNTFLGIPVLALWTILFLVLLYLLISKSKFGRRAQAVGGNEQAAYSSGVNVGLEKYVAYIIMGVVSAFVSITIVARLGTASPTYGAGYELKFIMAAVLGGTSFTGDGGNVFGTLLGSLVLGLLVNGLTILGMNYYLQQVITGIVILVTVIWSIYMTRNR